MMIRRYFFLLGLVLMTVLSGCGPKGMPLAPDSDAASRWKAFVQRSSHPAAYDILSGSLRFGPANDTRRVTYLLWSSNTGGPSVLDDNGHEPAGLDAADRIPGQQQCRRSGGPRSGRYGIFNGRLPVRGGNGIRQAAIRMDGDGLGVHPPV